MVCDETLLLRLNSCDIADVGGIFNLAGDHLQPMLDGASKSCKYGRGGFNAASSTYPGDGPGFAPSHHGDTAGKLYYQVILHRFLSCDNVASEGVELLCPCVHA
jgi:hypothetical protein